MKKIIGFLICALLIFSTTSFALTTFSRDEQQNKNIFFDTKQVPLPTSSGWIKKFGGSSYDGGWSVQQTSDGGYIITGFTDPLDADSCDVLLIKTDSNGYKQWQRNYGGINDDVGYSVKQTSDGGYIITGYMMFKIGDYSHVLLIKTDSNGREIFSMHFGGNMGNCGYCVEQTDDGGYIIAGNTWSFGAGESDVWLIKTDGNGWHMWDKTFGGKSSDGGRCIQQTIDGGYIITGYTKSYGVGDTDVWLIKTDADGNEMWNKTFGGIIWDGGNSVQQTQDAGYILTGHFTWLFGENNSDVWLIKTDVNGVEEWNRTFGGTNEDYGTSIQLTSDGGYIITGYTYSNGIALSSDVWLIKTNFNGVRIWDNFFGGIGDDYGYCVEQTSDVGYIIAGTTEGFGFGSESSDVLLIKTDNQGKSKSISLVNIWFEKLILRFPFFEKILNQYYY